MRENRKNAHVNRVNYIARFYDYYVIKKILLAFNGIYSIKDFSIRCVCMSRLTEKMRKNK